MSVLQQKPNNNLGFSLCKMHTDFVFVKRVFNKKQDWDEFNYPFLLELDDNTHNTHYKECLENRKNLLCKDNGITLWRVKI